LTAAGKMQQKFPSRCYKCDQEGHQETDCPENKGHNKCYECGRSGHKKADCWDLPENAHKRPAGYKPRSGQDAAANDVEVLIVAAKVSRKSENENKNELAGGVRRQRGDARAPNCGWGIQQCDERAHGVCRRCWWQRYDESW